MPSSTFVYAGVRADTVFGVTVALPAPIVPEIAFDILTYLVV